MVQTLAERRGLTVEHARQWLRPRRPRRAARGRSRATPSSSPPPARVLEEGVHQLADTVRNSLNFYRMQEHAEHVERGVVTGPAVAIPGFVEQLSEQLRLPVWRPRVVATEDDTLDVDRLTVAAGLAVAERSLAVRRR